MSNYPISVCMIVRDEEERLAEALSRLRGLAGEIIVVDTGSSDGSQDVARRSGAIVHEVLWEDDFSAPRNVALSKASLPWVLVLDADEVILPEDHQRILDLTTKEICCYTLTQRTYTNSPWLLGFVPAPEMPSGPRDFSGWIDGTLVRLFPRDPALRYSGVIHERVEPSIQGRYPIRESGIVIHHYGQSRGGDAFVKKRRLYLRLQEKKLAQPNPEWRSFFEVGVEYNIARRHEEAIWAFREALRRNPAVVEGYLHLANALQNLGRTDEAKEAVTTAISAGHSLVESYTLLGAIERESGNVESALTAFNAALALNPHAPHALNLKARLLARCNQLDEAIDLYRQLLEVVPAYPSARLDLSELLLRQGDFAQGSEHLLRVIEGSQEPRAYLQLALIMRHHGKTAETLAALETFCHLERSRGRLDEGRRQRLLAVERECEMLRHGAKSS